MNLREMFGLRVPVISVVIGEGGSGGALAIGCANWNLIMEHSVYYVASPEACAAILWKSRAKAGAVRAPQPMYGEVMVRAKIHMSFISRFLRDTGGRLARRYVESLRRTITLIA